VKVRIEADAAPEWREERTADESPGKDTARYLAAGAARAGLLTGPFDDALALARQLIAEASTDVVVFETDSLAQALGADLSLFVSAPGPWKPGADERRAAADVVIEIAPRPRGEGAGDE